MKMFLYEQVRSLTKNIITRHFTRRGSSTVFLAMVFVTFAVCIAGAIWISRGLTVMSECQAFGRVWTRAVLSEYDRHLLSDYGLMAYWGNDTEVSKKIDDYLEYSAAGKLSIKLGSTGSDLTGYELGEPGNFRKAMTKASATSAVRSIFDNSERRPLERGPGRSIGNTVVLDTLPSGGIGGSVGGDALAERAKELRDEEGVRNAAVSSGIETAFIWKYFSSYVTVPDDKPHFFNNEMEYVIRGSTDDDTNYEACRKRLLLMRNALDLVSLYRDQAKVELIVSVAELITPGPLGAATQLLLAEAWAALEAEADLDTLYENGREPVLKTPEQWHTDLSAVLDSKRVRKGLDEESRKLLDEKRDEIDSLSSGENAAEVFTEGLSYDDHLLIMIMCLSSSKRLLRIMDIVQIDMKYRYYRDFNLMEYYTGVRFAITANGRDYVFEDAYR